MGLAIFSYAKVAEPRDAWLPAQSIGLVLPSARLPTVVICDCEKQEAFDSIPCGSSFTKDNVSRSSRAGRASLGSLRLRAHTCNVGAQLTLQSPHWMIYGLTSAPIPGPRS